MQWYIRPKRTAEGRLEVFVSGIPLDNLANKLPGHNRA